MTASSISPHDEDNFQRNIFPERNKISDCKDQIRIKIKVNNEYKSCQARLQLPPKIKFKLTRKISL